MPGLHRYDAFHMLLLPWAILLCLSFLFIESKGQISVQTTIRALAHSSYFTLNSCLLMLIVPVLFSASFGKGTTGVSQGPFLFQFFSLLVILDLFSFGLHVLSHRLPFLYYFHQVHHSDEKVDASTALRMHIVQMFYSLAPDLVLISVLRPSRDAYLFYAFVTQFFVLLHHSRLTIPKWIDILFVTPETHLEHHKHPVNFGSVFSFWDRFFETFSRIESSMPVGLPGGYSPFSYRELFVPHWRKRVW